MNLRSVNTVGPLLYRILHSRRELCLGCESLENQLFLCFFRFHAGLAEHVHLNPIGPRRIKGGQPLNSYREWSFRWNP